jgi:arsenate reductase-like glutaredoxin family protein
MTIEEKIIQYIHELPEHEKAELLDFIDYLKTKGERKEMKEWAQFSLSSAMRGMETEDTPYSLDDLKESFS